jgi:hypothetical protein
MANSRGTADHDKVLEHRQSERVIAEKGVAADANIKTAIRRRSRSTSRIKLRLGAKLEADGQAHATARLRAPPREETSMATFRGSCLCGEVAFEIEGPFDLFLNCHCSRCRKATGTAHSCEVIVKASALRWLRGEESVVRFELPQARSFATAFCKTCGSPMPHLTRSGREAIVPAGGFDEPLGAAPDRHVHWSSRADWYVHGDGLLVQE